MFAIAVLLALAGYGFYSSLGGQKLFEGKLLEEGQRFEGGTVVMKGDRPLFA